MSIVIRIATVAAWLAAIWLGEAQAQTKWAEYRFAAHGFAAAFPAAPKLVTRPLGGPLEVTQFEYQFAGANYGYDVSVMQFGAGRGPKEPLGPYFNRLIDVYAKGTGSTVKSRQPVTLAGHDGAEAVADDTEHAHTYLLDVVAAGDRVYFMSSVNPIGTGNSADPKHFRDSFKLIGP